MIYQIVDWAATYIECFVLLAAIAQISGKKLAGIKHILLLCLFSLTDCILVATLNSIQSFSFLTPIASILFCFFVSAGFSTGKVALRAAACIMTVFVILMSTEQTPVFFAAPKYPAMLSKLAKGRTESYGDSARGPTWQSHEQRFPAALQ